VIRDRFDELTNFSLGWCFGPRLRLGRNRSAEQFVRK
jgi:hypothetical protein